MRLKVIWLAGWLTCCLTDGDVGNGDDDDKIYFMT